MRAEQHRAGGSVRSPPRDAQAKPQAQRNLGKMGLGPHPLLLGTPFLNSPSSGVALPCRGANTGGQVPPPLPAS